RARRLLVAAVDAARLDEPARARRVHAVGDARLERLDPARARARGDHAADRRAARVPRRHAAGRHAPPPPAPQRAVANPGGPTTRGYACRFRYSSPSTPATIAASSSTPPRNVFTARAASRGSFTA